MYRALSFLKKVSVTMALPIAAAEKGHNGSAQCHCAIAGTLSAANISDEAYNKRYKEERPPAVSIGKRFPEERSNSKDRDLKRC